MIDLSKIREITQGTQALAQQLQQINASQSAQPAQAAQQQDPTNSSGSLQSATNALFAQLGALINNAANQPAQAQSNPDLAELQRQAALINAKVTSLIAKADALEGELNLSPTPDDVSVDDLLGQFKEILAELTKEIDALNKKVQEKKKADEMKLEQKPTAMKVGEEAGDLSFNQTQTTV